MLKFRFLIVISFILYIELSKYQGTHVGMADVHVSGNGEWKVVRGKGEVQNYLCQRSPPQKKLSTNFY